MLIEIIGLFSEEELAETNERLKQKKYPHQMKYLKKTIARKYPQKW